MDNSREISQDIEERLAMLQEAEIYYDEISKEYPSDSEQANAYQLKADKANILIDNFFMGNSLLEPGVTFFIRDYLADKATNSSKPSKRKKQD